MLYVNLFFFELNLFQLCMISKLLDCSNFYIKQNQIKVVPFIINVIFVCSISIFKAISIFISNEQNHDYFVNFLVEQILIEFWIIKVNLISTQEFLKVFFFIRNMKPIKLSFTFIQLHKSFFHHFFNLKYFFEYGLVFDCLPAIINFVF